MQQPFCISISAHLAPLHRQSEIETHTEAHIQHWIVGGGNCRWRCTPSECAVSSGCDLRMFFFSRAQLAHYFHWLKDVSALFKMISAGPGRILWWPAVCSAWLVPLRKSLQSVPLNWRPTFSKTGLCFLLQIHAHPSQEATYSGWMQSDSNSSH